jgi:hypothetical protein
VTASGLRRDSYRTVSRRTDPFEVLPNNRFAKRAGVGRAIDRGGREPHRVRPPSGGVRCWRSNSGHALPAVTPVLSCGDHDTRELSLDRALHSGLHNDWHPERSEGLRMPDRVQQY